MQGSVPLTVRLGVKPSGTLVPMPTLPPLKIRIFSVAAPDEAVKKAISVALTDAENVPSASPIIEAPTTTASVPASSTGA